MARRLLLLLLFALPFLVAGSVGYPGGGGGGGAGSASVVGNDFPESWESEATVYYRTAGNFLSVNYASRAIGTPATQTVTFSGTGSGGDTVTLDGVVYTIQGTPDDPYEVDIGGDAEGTADNLAAAINRTGTPGTDYDEGTAPHPSFRASADSGVVTLASRWSGWRANDLTVAVSGSDLAAGGATAIGGLPGTPDTCGTTYTEDGSDRLHSWQLAYVFPGNEGAADARMDCFTGDTGISKSNELHGSLAGPRLLIDLVEDDSAGTNMVQAQLKPRASPSVSFLGDSRPLILTAQLGDLQTNGFTSNRFVGWATDVGGDPIFDASWEPDDSTSEANVVGVLLENRAGTDMFTFKHVFRAVCIRNGSPCSGFSASGNVILEIDNASGSNFASGMRVAVLLHLANPASTETGSHIRLAVNPRYAAEGASWSEIVVDDAAPNPETAATPILVSGSDGTPDSSQTLRVGIRGWSAWAEFNDSTQW